MAGTPMTGVQKLPAFFASNGLNAGDLQHCMQYVRHRHPQSAIEEVAGQGGCSYTIIVTQPNGTTRGSDLEGSATLHDRIVFQFRLVKHAIQIAIAREAGQWYGSLAPIVRSLGDVVAGRDKQLQVYQMSYMEGTRFSDLQPRVKYLDDICVKQYLILLESVAEFYITSWQAGVRRKRDRETLECNGRVGSTVLPRLRKLEQLLPTPSLRKFAMETRLKAEGGGLDSLPVVLTHGDLLPSNILVDSKTSKITGLVDWAEAEYLPFGMSLYGLDHLLGYLEGSDAGQPSFIYYEQANLLRSHFWEILRQRIFHSTNQCMQRVTALSRDMGVLLWHGIAFDDGKIDRVVELGEDDIELAYLKAFTSSTQMTLNFRL